MENSATLSASASRIKVYMSEMPTYYIEKRFKELQERIAELESQVKENQDPFPACVTLPGPRLVLLLLLAWFSDTEDDSDEVVELRMLCEDLCSMGADCVDAYLPRLQLLFNSLPRYCWRIFEEEHQRVFKTAPRPLLAGPEQSARRRWTSAARGGFGDDAAHLPAPARAPAMLPGEEGELLKEYEDWRGVNVVPQLPQLIRMQGALVSEIIELENRSRNTRPNPVRRGLLTRAADKWARILNIESPDLWSKPSAGAGDSKKE